MHASVGFLVYPREQSQADPEALRVEMGPFHPGPTTIRLTDKWGHLLLEEAYEPAQSRCLITVHDLEDGTYFFEVNDGFFHQIKEVHISH